MNLGDLEMQVMDRLWSSEGWTSVGEVHQSLGDLAYTTVMTVMTNLHAKGALERRKEGKAYLYRPLVTREEAGRGMAGRIRRGLFGNRLPDFMAALLGGEDLTKEDVQALRRRLDELEGR